MLIALDTETALFSPGNMAPPLACVSLAWRGETDVEARLVHHTEVDFDWFKLWTDCAFELVGMTIDYDMAVLCAHIERTHPTQARDFLDYVFSLYEAGRIHDIYTRRQFIDIADGVLYSSKYTLEAFGQEIGITLDKDTWRLRYGALLYLPLNAWPKGAREYPLEDAKTTLLVHEEQERQLAARGDGWLMENEPMRTAEAFAMKLRGVWGMTTDGARVDKLERFVNQKLEHYQAKLMATGLAVYKSKGRGDAKVIVGVKKETKKIKALLVDVLGDDVPFTEKGNVSTSKDILEKFDTESDVPGASAILEAKLAEKYAHIEPAKLDALAAVAKHGKWQKVLTTYVKTLKEGVSQPIHSHMRMVETGRYGSDKNSLTMPRSGPVRPAYKARDGYVIGCTDLDSAEFRCWAQIMVDLFGLENTPAAQMYQADPDADPHVKFGAENFLKITYEEGLRLKEAGDKALKNARQASKAANFGLPGGLGPKTLQTSAAKGYGYIMTLDEAEDITRNWKTFWNAWPFFKYVEREVTGKGYLAQHRSNRVRGGLGYCDGCNTLFQGLNADAVSYAVFKISKVCYTGRNAPDDVDAFGVKAPRDSVLYGARIINVPHDEIQAEYLAHIASEQAIELQRLFNKYVQEWLPDVPVTSSPALMTHLVKEVPKEFGKPDANGKYQVYQVPDNYGYKDYGVAA